MSASQSKTIKRFYTAAAVAARANGNFAIELDGRAIKTPAGRELAVPARMLAEAIAQEWNEQGDDIVLSSLPLTRLANSAIDGIVGREEQVVDDIMNYAGSDLVCYRAGSPAALAQKEAEEWDAILAWFKSEYDAPFSAGSGLAHIQQSQASLQAVRGAVVALGPFQLAALHVMTALTGSALIALAHAKGFLDSDGAWRAAHVDEEWQKAKWGEDFEAAQRHKARFEDFLNASRFFALA